MRSLFVAILIAVLSFAASCSGGSMVDLDQEQGKQVSNAGFDSPDYIFWDGEGDQEIE